ncbi:MAG: restriction endonuclease subunit S [Candidatus Binatus sp.]|uniref:restriction endonuclease subunit S n=1 Tax=Candidatus Binatus sp. TaxID=2811406 RepID=UPI00271DE69C|nr:restriction endonuclease subunit S [Candidatus Binatus sp.]MDO8433854.1 restriction endonuclease subunit S [Candidatus Binatus sp.]
MSEETPRWPLPQWWVWTTMSEVAEIVGGSTPSTDVPENFASSGIPWITPADLSGYKAKLISRGSRDISDKGLASSSTRLMPAGTVLFSSRAPIGYVAIAANPVTTNQGFKSFLLSQGVLAEYAYYWLIRAKSLLSEFASGTTFLEISGKRAQQIPIPIAPRGEQRRIIGAIESLLPKLDAAVAALERVRANLKRCRASVLKAAVEGRLVPTEAELARKEGRDFEHASVLLDRILVERRRRWEETELTRMKAAGKPPKDDRWKSKYKEPVAPDTTALPQLPDGWCWATVDQISCDVRYGTSAKTREKSAGVPVLRMGNIVDGELEFMSLKYLPEDHSEFPELLLDTGDLLFNRTNSADLVGKTAIFKDQGVPFSFASYLIRVRLLSGCLPDYVSSFLNSFHGRRWIGSVVSQVVGQANVNGSKLKNCLIPLPPISEQRRVMLEVDRMSSVIRSSAVTCDLALVRLERLRQSILKWAFEGKLVDQDPNDEPASGLLEHIRAERTSSAHP